MTEAKEKVTEAKPRPHAGEVKKLKELTGQTMKISESNHQLIVKFEKGLEERKQTGILLLSLIGLVVVFLYLKNESLKKKE